MGRVSRAPKPRWSIAKVTFSVRVNYSCLWRRRRSRFNRSDGDWGISERQLGCPSRYVLTRVMGSRLFFPTRKPLEQRRVYTSRSSSSGKNATPRFSENGSKPEKSRARLTFHFLFLISRCMIRGWHCALRNNRSSDSSSLIEGGGAGGGVITEMESGAPLWPYRLPRIINCKVLCSQAFRDRRGALRQLRNPDGLENWW